MSMSPKKYNTVLSDLTKTANNADAITHSYLEVLTFDENTKVVLPNGQEVDSLNARLKNLWDGYTLSSKYPNSMADTFTFDVSKHHNVSRGQNLSAIPSEWLIVSNWQASNGNGFGAYKLIVMLMPSGQYHAIAQPIGVTSPVGFVSAPTISTSGVITVQLNQFYRGAIYRADSRKTIL